MLVEDAVVTLKLLGVQGIVIALTGLLAADSPAALNDFTVKVAPVLHGKFFRSKDIPPVPTCAGILSATGATMPCS